MQRFDPSPHGANSGVVSDDPDHVAAARAYLRSDFATARGWAELQGRLMLKGYCLRECDDRLTLCRRADSRRICHGADLGVPYDTLKRRFGLPLPSASGLGF